MVTAKIESPRVIGATCVATNMRTKNAVAIRKLDPWIMRSRIACFAPRLQVSVVLPGVSAG
jgi:hypothetical protein